MRELREIERRSCITVREKHVCFIDVNMRLGVTFKVIDINLVQG